MIWRIRDRAVFGRFRRDGRRARVGPLWMSVIADPAAVPPRMAFSIGRSVGSAPVRNRIRRRLRAIARARADQLAPGWYLVGADAEYARTPFALAEEQFLQAAEKVGVLVTPTPRGPLMASTTLPRPARRPGVVARGLTRVIGWYQVVHQDRVSPCRFVPSCSTYALEAVSTRGALRGSVLAAAPAGPLPSLGRPRLRPRAPGTLRPSRESRPACLT